MTFHSERKKKKRSVTEPFPGQRIQRNETETECHGNHVILLPVMSASAKHQSSVNSHVKHHCHDTDSQQSNKFTTASGLLPVPQLCDDAVTRLHVQLELCDDAVTRLHVQLELCDDTVTRLHVQLELCDDTVTRLHVQLELCDDTVTRLHVQLEPVDFSAMAQRV